MINVSELDKNIKKLVQYGINSGLIPESERNYSTNMILDAFGKDDYFYFYGFAVYWSDIFQIT